MSDSENSFEWVGGKKAAVRTGIQVIGGKKIEHKKMHENLVNQRANAKLRREAEGIVSGRVEAPLMSYNKQTQEVTWIRHRPKSGPRQPVAVKEAPAKGKKK